MDAEKPNTPDTPADADLVLRMGTGDGDAFAALFRRHQRTVYRFAHQMTGAADAAEDVTQEVFVALARRGDGYRPDQGSLTTYLYGIARNLVRQRERRHRVRAETGLPAVGEDEPPAPFADPADALARTRRLAALRHAILRLPPHYREVIVLCELNAVPYEEAATIVGCAVGTIRSRLNRARRLLADRCRAAAKADEDEAAARFERFLQQRRSAAPAPAVTRRPGVLEPQS